MNLPYTFPRDDRLTPQQRVAFGLACLEQLYPGYVLWERQVLGPPRLHLRQMIDSCWDALAFPEPPHKLLLGYISQLAESNETEVEKHSFLLSERLAESATCCFQAIVVGWAGDSSSIVKTTAELVHDAIGDYLHACSYPFGEFVVGSMDLDRKHDEWLLQSPLHLVEADRQTAVVTRLEQAGELSSALLSDLKRPAKELGIDFFRRGILR